MYSQSISFVFFLKAYRGLLTLDAGAVEPQSRDAVRAALDVEDALVVPLARLRLGKVLGQQRDGPHDSGRHIGPGNGGEKMRKEGSEGAREGGSEGAREGSGYRGTGRRAPGPGPQRLARQH
ncbi:hypothetical protein EYF80_030427 [Liparis tanakae]|uniref:Uncharacterized protein n=1 Tax=Liparis tanakae TaxID=230148 RepID=A0A4Z2H3D4_9TELE|nr:hypothetical protein EYF80_030427 [Liparis tanakae]